MKTRVVILAGGEGARLGILTAKRAKPAVPFAGKYRIIDFTLSNCVNSGLFDVMILAQYRPHSLIEHIGAGGPWDLNRDFTGGVRIYTPYRARGQSDWYLGTADAVQQNFRFIKSNRPDMVLILSGDHIYEMNYDAMIAFHLDHRADVTIGVARVPIAEASRFGVVSMDDDYLVRSFVEKPPHPTSDTVNMGVYLFNLSVLDEVLWQDHNRPDSSHDFGKDILPYLITNGYHVRGFPYTGYWVDVGTLESYWQAHMDLLATPPSIDLNDRSWVIHTRTEERPPVRLSRGSVVCDSMIADGCVIEPGAKIERSILSPGVRVLPDASIHESIILTDTVIGARATICRSIIDKKVVIEEECRIGESLSSQEGLLLCTIGKNSHLPAGTVVEAGAVISTDVVPSDFPSHFIQRGAYIQTKRKPYEV